MKMSELEQIRREWVDITRKNGFREGITDLLAHQYPKKTHFIFELLQNAEDALATEVEFRVESQRLVFRHNGERLFSDKNVESITSIGKSTKQADYTQIGKHGIGFKAVFAYTHIPRIHSGDKHFDIEDVVIPRFLKNDELPTDLESEETRIILPFDSDSIPESRRFRSFVPAETAMADISRALKNLNVRTLLFLRHIEKIHWSLVDGTVGAISRKPRTCANGNLMRYVDLTDGVRTESWIIFEKETHVTDEGSAHECIIEVAFLVENGKVIPARNTELVVYFPTEKKTGLAFLIQGPFKTTKARDNIKDDPANQDLLKIAAQLAADSLISLRDRDLLNVNSYNALPLQKLEDSFYPLYDNIRETLKTKSLLPAYDGTFIKAQEAKLARGKELVELFSPEQLGILFGKKKLSWLDDTITESGAMADLHTYLIGQKKYQWSRDWEIEPLCDGLLVDAESLVPKLTADFLGRQPFLWLIKFIQYIVKPKSSSELKRTPFIRLTSGKQVALPANEKIPRPAWFAPADDTGLDLKVFPLVHPELSTNEEIRKFLEKEGIREIDAVAIVEKSVLPKYQEANSCFDESTYRSDLSRIREAYCKANDAEKAQLASVLNKHKWLASVHASGNAPDKIVWKKPGAFDLFEKNTDHETWFNGLEDANAFFLHTSVIEALNGFLTCLTQITTTLTSKLSKEQYTITISNQYCEHKQGLAGFDPRATIVGIEVAFANWNQNRSMILWNLLLYAPLRIISGETQSSTNRQKLDKVRPKVEYTNVGELCRKKEWLIDKTGNWHKPSKLLLSDLPKGYVTSSIAAKELSVKIGMKQPEREQAIEMVTGGDPNLKRLIEHYQSAPDDERKKILKIIPHETLPEPALSFKDGLRNLARPQRGVIEPGVKDMPPQISNPDRYHENLKERIEEGVEEHQSASRKITFSPVRDQPSNSDARQFLYEQYHGCCQVTGATFPMASRSSDGMAKNYFEACSLLSYGNADYLNDPGNMICVSADTMAKFKYANVEFMENLEDAIETFKANGRLAERISVKIRLAGEERYIQWSQRHFMRLVALYEKA